MINDMPNDIWAYGDPLNGWYEDDQCTQGGVKYTRAPTCKKPLQEDCEEALADVDSQPLEPWVDDDDETYVGYTCINVKTHRTIRTALAKPKTVEEEWFFRWIARGKAGHAGMTMEQCADMIWHSPDNPYRHENPWEE